MLLENEFFHEMKCNGMTSFKELTTCAHWHTYKVKGLQTYPYEQLCEHLQDLYVTQIIHDN